MKRALQDLQPTTTTRSVTPYIRLQKSQMHSNWVMKRVGMPQCRQSAKLFLQPSELGLTQPLTRRRVCPPASGGRALSLARERLGESQFRRRDIHCGTLYILYVRTLWGMPPI
jgi:hypothetical protein